MRAGPGRTRRAKTVVLGAVVAVAAFHCNVIAPTLAATEPPAWVTSLAAAYPPDAYLVGTGRGATPEEAAEAARADLATGFRARIRSAATVIDEVSEWFGEEGNRFDRETRTRRATKIETDEVVANIVSGGAWFDSAAGVHHALVYVERAKAEQTVGADIEACRTRIEELLACDGCYPDPLNELAAANGAREGIRDYERLSAQLRVISNGRRGEVDGALVSRVAKWREAARTSCTVSVVAAPPELESDLRAALLAAGFTVVGAPARYEVELAYATDSAPESEFYVFETWKITLRLRDTADGADIVSLNLADKAGHKTREAAQLRCLREAKEALAGRVTDMLAETVSANTGQ